MKQAFPSVPNSHPRPRLTTARRLLLDRLLDDLLQVDDAARKERLDRVRSRAPRLYLWLTDLLDASREPTQYLQGLFRSAGKAAHRANIDNEVVLPPGTRLGPWRVVEAVGSGGMGAVYRAERADDAFEMMVAIKLIRLRQEDLDQRLQVERQLLARLNHPHIARLIDGGRTEDGHAYLVMEWVEGHDLDEFVDHAAPDLSNRLDLFEQIVEAVGHAHQRRVVHGDLKPANVRVSESGHVRLVDFGVARLVLAGEGQSDSFVKALTPAFSAPEQLRGEANSTQSDIWSLGVILQWLISGHLRDGKADRPNANELPKNMPHRSDLTAIISRACEDDPDARYAGAPQLLDDVRRCRAHHPVFARTQTHGYVLSRLVRRHRLVTSLILTASVVMGVAVVGALWQAQQATLERDRAEAEAERALSAEQQSERLAGELQQVVDFQSEQLSDIDVASMGTGLRREIIEMRRVALKDRGVDDERIAEGMRDLDHSLAGINFTDLALATLSDNIFGHTLERIDEQFGEQPLVRARLMQTVATTVRNLGLSDQAETPQREALRIRRDLLGNDHPDTLDSIDRMAYLYGRMGRRDEQKPLYQEALAGYRSLLGDLHPKTLNAVSNMGSHYYGVGRLEDAELYFREALDGRILVLGEGHLDTLISISNMGALLRVQQRFDEAVPYYRDVLNGRRRALGNDHPQTLMAVNNMGVLLRDMERPDDAKPYYREALEGRRRVLGDDHPVTMQSVNNMGFLLQSMGRLEEAEPYYLEAVAQSRSMLGERHPRTLVYMNNTSSLLQSLERLEEAEQLAAEVIAHARLAYSSDHWHMGVFLTRHALSLVDLDRFEEAESPLLQAYEIYHAGLGEDHPRTVDVVSELSGLYASWHKAEPGQGYGLEAASWRERIAD